MNYKKKREEAQLTQAQVAKKIGVGQSAVAMWESGEAKPRAAHLIALARLFGCTIDELLITE